MQIFETKQGMIGTNSYLCYLDDIAIIIDLGSNDIDDILNKIKKDKKQLKAILFTHGHYDHILGLFEILKIYPNIEIYIGKKEVEFLENPTLNLSYFTGQELKFDVSKLNLKLILDGDEVFGSKIIETPGHTVGCVSYYFEKEKICFVGDLIFSMGRAGRTDFPTSNQKDMNNSIEKINKIDKETQIYSGHEDSFVLKNW